MTFELGRSLLISGSVTPDKLSEALYAVIPQGVPLARALVGLGIIDEAHLEEELGRAMPEVALHITPSVELIERLPHGLCHRLAVAPLGVDPETGAVELAVLDPRDGHPAAEVAYHLGTSVRARRATYAALREALESHPAGLRSLAPPMGSRGVPGASEAPRRTGSHLPPAPTPEWGTPLAPIEAALGKLTSPDEVRFQTRTWDSPASGAPASMDEASWDAEPVFELRRLGPPPTVPDPEPVTVRLALEDASQYSLRSPLPARVPIAPNAPALPFGDLGSILASIRSATDRDAVLGLVQLAARSVARRVALLVVRKDSLAGWSCTPEFGNEDALKQLKIPLRAPNLLTAVLSGGVHLGPLMGTVAAPLLRVMRTASQDVAIAALRVGDRPAVLIVADDLGDTLLATKRLDELARAAGDALLRILRTKRE